MKKIAKRLALNTQTIRPLQSDELRHVAGGTTQSGTSVISASGGTSVIRPTTGASGTIPVTGTSVSISGGH